MGEKSGDGCGDDDDGGDQRLLQNEMPILTHTEKGTASEWMQWSRLAPAAHASRSC